MTLTKAKANKTFIEQMSHTKISWNILKTFNVNINSMNSVAYFATAKSYAKVSYSQCKQKNGIIQGGRLARPK